MSASKSGSDFLKYSQQAVVKKVQFLIDANHETVPAVARAIGVTQLILQDVLDGNSDISPSLVARLARHFQVDEFFLTGVVAVRGVEKKQPDPISEVNPAVEEGNEQPGEISVPETLNLKMLAVRHQALVELMIEKKVFTSAEYHSSILDIQQRSKSSV